MAEPYSLKELACEAVSALCFNTLIGFPSALPQYFEDEALKTMLIPVREICLEKLNDMVTKEVPSSEGPPMDYCTILEGILDDHLESLEISTPLPCRSSFSKLMSVLSHKCPKLKWLEIDFSNNHAGIQLASVTPAPTPQLTFSLNHLKSLSLFRSSWLQQDEPLPLISLESLLGIIGQTCPKLEELDFSDFSNIDEKRSILALLMGQDLARALFPFDGMWARDSILYKLRIPTGYLSPVCFTLERLLPFRVDHYGAEYAFALRHLPKLRHWNFKNTGDDEDIPIYLIKALHRAEEEKDSNQLQQEAFEAACRSSAAALNLNVAASSTLLSGPLSSIRNIDYVLVRDWNALTAVGTMCPHLNVIDFQDVDNPDDYVSTYSTSQYGKMFKDCWSMAHKPYIHLIGLNPDFVSILLNAFGSSMTNLTLINCRRVNLTDLWQCTQLERLSVTNSSINSETSDPAIRTSGSTFLPSLLRVHCCAVSFPNWSFWLESKSSLIKQRE